MPSFDSLSIRAPQQFPPILRLNTDVLLYVFFMNADMEQEISGEDNGVVPAVVTLRHSSQVCVIWRNLILGSPSLWARVLNLNSLLSNGNMWMKKVLRRTGTTFLHIKSVMHKGGKTLTDAKSVQWLLEEHWTRIRSLNLELGREFIPENRPWRSLFQRPAPSLEFFRFSWSRKPRYFQDPDFCLFSGLAPSLHTLSVADIAISLNTLQSVPKLCSLRLELKLDSLVQENRPMSLIDVLTLPRLTTIKFNIESSVNFTLACLAHIIPAAGCALDFSGTYFGGEIPDHNSQIFYKRILSVYSRSCTELSTATNLEVIFFMDCISFAVDLPSGHRFSFGLRISSYTFPDGILPDLISSFITIPFTVIQLGEVTKLGLYIGDQGTDAADMNPEVAKLVLALVSVEELETNRDTNDFLLEETRGGSTFLPALKVMRLHFISVLGDLLVVADFINARAELGLPVDNFVVKIEELVDFDLQPFRDRIPGVTVIEKL